MFEQKKYEYPGIFDLNSHLTRFRYNLFMFGTSGLMLTYKNNV